MGFFSDQKSSPTRGWAFVPTGLYFLLPVMRINLQVLAGSGGMICSLVDPCLFGDTGIEPAEQKSSSAEQKSSSLETRELNPRSKNRTRGAKIEQKSSKNRTCGAKIEQKST
jgi:hypothetical protein